MLKQLPGVNENVRRGSLESNRLNLQIPQVAALSVAALSVNFIELPGKRPKQQKIETQRTEKFNAGNHDSADFFKKMGVSLAAAEKARKACSEMSKALHATDAVAKELKECQYGRNLHHIRNCVESAQEIAFFSHDYVCVDKAGRPQPTPPVAAPGLLGHLQAPGLPQSARSESKQARSPTPTQDASDRAPSPMFLVELEHSEKMRLERQRKAAEKEQAMLLLQGGQDKIDDYTLAWVNQYFKLEVETKSQYHGAFPVIMLSMIDVIYPDKIRWHQVDWNAFDVHAFHRNHSVLETVWKEINMHELRDFRSDMTALQIEDTAKASVEEKLAFLKTVKRWFDQRVEHSAVYDPIARRTEIDRKVRTAALGRCATYPSWMKNDTEAIQAARCPVRCSETSQMENTSSAETQYDKVPKRHIWYLGPADDTSMW